METTAQTKKRKKFYPVQGIKRGDITGQIQEGGTFITFTNEYVAYSTTDGYTSISKRFTATPETDVVETTTARWFSMLLQMQETAESAGEEPYLDTGMTNKDVYLACMYVTDTVMRIPCGAFMNDKTAIDTAFHFMDTVEKLMDELKKASSKKPEPETLEDIKANEKAYNTAIMAEEAEDVQI